MTVFFLHGATASCGSGTSRYDHTQTHYTQLDSSGRVISPSQRPLSNNTRQSQDCFI